jgi:hypothetical protein
MMPGTSDRLIFAFVRFFGVYELQVLQVFLPSLTASAWDAYVI